MPTPAPKGEIQVAVPCAGAGDQIAVLLGLPGTHPGVVVDDYPGAGNRTQSLDGQFVSITATVAAVPEPGAGLLLALGALATHRAARRHQKG